MTQSKLPHILIQPCYLFIIAFRSAFLVAEVLMILTALTDYNFCALLLILTEYSHQLRHTDTLV